MFDLQSSETVRSEHLPLSTQEVSRPLTLIDQLDLGPIKFKLVVGDDGPKWSAAQAQLAETWYKRFLILNLKYPKSVIVPNKIIDQFWHQHILDTRKYAQDCESAFGAFLHHFPYFGIRNAEDATNLKHTFEQTKDLFEREFGESLQVLEIAFSASLSASSVCQGSECGSAGPGSCESGPGDGDAKIERGVKASACMGTECGGTACGDTNKVGFDSLTRPTLCV